jgi:hypothetical protein
MWFGGDFSRLSVVLSVLVLAAINTNASAMTSRASAATSREVFTFSSKLQSGVSLQYVNNSGICETTPGVHTMSGYITVGTGMSMVCSYLLQGYLDDNRCTVVLVFRSPQCVRNGAIHFMVCNPRVT